MLVELWNWDIHILDIQKSKHSYEEIYLKLEKESKYALNELNRLNEFLPQIKPILPYFYDYIFSLNYFERDKNFIKNLLLFPSSYEAEQILFSIVDITGWLWLPSILEKSPWKIWWIINKICVLIWEINEHGCWYYLWGILTRKQIRIVLEECAVSENPLETWVNRITEVEYSRDYMSKLWDENPWIWKKILYCIDLPFI